METDPANDDDLLQPLIELFRLQPPHVVVHHHNHDSDEEEDEEDDAEYTPGEADESTSEEDQTDTVPGQGSAVQPGEGELPYNRPKNLAQRCLLEKTPGTASPPPCLHRRLLLKALLYTCTSFSITEARR